MEEEVCRAAARPDAAAQAARGRECTAEEDRGGADTGSGDATGRYPAKNLKPGRLRELVRGMCSDWAVSIRAACGAMKFDCSTFYHKSRRTDQASVERRIKEICEMRVHYGYRRVHVLLRRESAHRARPRRNHPQVGAANRAVKPGIHGF